MDRFGMMNSFSMPNAYTASSLDIFDTSTMSWNAIIGYTVVILLIFLILLVFIHYTITPIFQLMPGGPGFIRIPFKNTSESYWKPDSKPYTVPDMSGTKVEKMGGNWAMSLDICIMDISQRTTISGSDGFRLIFNRGGSLPLQSAITSDGSITSVIKDYNIVIGLVKDTNDLVVSVMNDKGNPENIIITNVPTQTPFRLGINLMDSAFEVYMNGKLAKIRKLASNIKTVPSAGLGPLFQGPGQFDVKYRAQDSLSQASVLTKMVRVGHLIIWNHEVLPSIMKEALPALMPLVPSMDSVATGSLCGSSDNSTFSSLTSGLSGLATTGQSSLLNAERAAQTAGVQDAIATLGRDNQLRADIASANTVLNS